MISTSSGLVSLVGAGPGAPDLLTLRAADRLRRADLVLYDALVPPAIVATATQAQRFCVGKRASRKSVQQETIIRVMVRAAQRGRRVVRLKCGDPFVLGRGGEEALALKAAGIHFEIVPGLTSAVTAPAWAGIPVTHRGITSAFIVVSGHDASSFQPALETIGPETVTVVVLMGMAQRVTVADCLLKRGWPPETPAAVALGATTDDGQCWIGTLAELKTMQAAFDTTLPGTIVVGHVVRLHAGLAGTTGSEKRALDERLAASAHLASNRTKAD